MSRATLRTTHGEAVAVAAALAPDNTDEMRTAAVDGTVETRIERPTAAGLRTTVDDYLVCLSAATAVADGAPDPTGDVDRQPNAPTTDRDTDDRFTTNS